MLIRKNTAFRDKPSVLDGLLLLAVLMATFIGDYLGSSLSHYHLGNFLPFVIATALKMAQGSFRGLCPSRRCSCCR